MSQRKLYLRIRNIILLPKERKDNCTNLRLEQHILESGLEDSGMDLEFKFGLMVLDMKVNGKTTELMVTDDLFTLMEMFMKETG